MRPNLNIALCRTGYTAGNSTRDRSDPLWKQHIGYTCEGREGTSETIPQGCDKLRTMVEFPSCVSLRRDTLGLVLICFHSGTARPYREDATQSI